MSEWKESVLDDIALINPSESLVKGSHAKKVAMELLIPFTKRVSGYTLEPYNGGMKFRNGDTIVARITPCLENGKTAYIDILDINEIGFGSTEYIVLRQREGISDKQFLYYFAISDEFRDVAILAMTGSSGRQRVETDVVRNHRFLLPSLPEQKAIASVLSSLDDKIDLLHRQNKTLEAIAEALFRQWFMEPCKDGLPEGWKESNIDSLVSVKSGTTPSTSNPDYWGGEIHWTSPRDITNLNGIFLFNTERKITELGLKQIGSGLLPTKSLLMSSRAPVGVLAFTEIPVAINQGYAGIVCDKGFSREFIYLWLKTNMDYVQSHANGSTFQEISKSSFKSLLIPIADKKYMNRFDSLISPLFLKLKKNSMQFHTIEKLRDTLLPKLMSGEVRVKV